MRHNFIPQMSLDSTDISEIEFNIFSRHEMVPILMALQYLYTDCLPLVYQILQLIESDILIGQTKSRGCIGLSYWEILVIASVRLGCDTDFDQLSDLADNHKKLRQMLGLGDSDIKSYPKSTIHDNLSSLKPETVKKIYNIIVAAGHEISPDAVKKLRADTFVVKKNIHYPTDSNLLYDAVRKIIGHTVKLATENEIAGWRKHKFWSEKVRTVKRKIEKTAAGRAKNKEKELRKLYEELIDIAQEITERSLLAVHEFQEKKKAENEPLSPFFTNLISELQYFIAASEYISELARRRIINGEEIPNPEKIFSIFEPDTELINRGKKPVPYEFGHRVLIIQDSAGFIVQSCILDNGITDEKLITEVMRNLQNRFNGKIHAVSFDKGFWTPNNLKELSEFIPLVVLPKKGRRSEADSKREGAEEFGKMRRWHSGIESSIGSLVSGNGLSVCRDKDVDGYDRYVGMAVLGRNLHNLGNILIEKERKRKEKYPLSGLCA